MSPRTASFRPVSVRIIGRKRESYGKIRTIRLFVRFCVRIAYELRTKTARNEVAVEPTSFPYSSKKVLLALESPSENPLKKLPPALVKLQKLQQKASSKKRMSHIVTQQFIADVRM